MDFYGKNLIEINKDLSKQNFVFDFAKFTTKHKNKNTNTINQCILYVLLYGVASLQSELAEAQIKLERQQKRLLQGQAREGAEKRLGFWINYENRLKNRARSKNKKLDLNVFVRLVKGLCVQAANHITGEQYNYTPIQNIFYFLEDLNDNNLMNEEELKLVCNKDLEMLYLAGENFIYKSGLSISNILYVVENLAAKTETVNKTEIDNFIDLLRKNTNLLFN